MNVFGEAEYEVEMLPTEAWTIRRLRRSDMERSLTAQCSVEGLLCPGLRRVGVSEILMQQWCGCADVGQTCRLERSSTNLVSTLLRDGLCARVVHSTSVAIGVPGSRVGVRNRRDRTGHRVMPLHLSAIQHHDLLTILVAGSDSTGGLAGSRWAVSVFFLGWISVGLVLALVLVRRGHDARVTVGVGAGLGLSDAELVLVSDRSDRVVERLEPQRQLNVVLVAEARTSLAGRRTI